MDDVRLHDRVVTAATVGAMYATRDSVPPQPTSGPVTFVPPFPDGFVQTRWPVADDDHVVREYRVTVNDSTWTTTTQGNFYNYRYEADSTYALSLRSVDYSGNVGAGAYDTVFVWPRATPWRSPPGPGPSPWRPTPSARAGDSRWVASPRRAFMGRAFAPNSSRSTGDASVGWVSRAGRCACLQRVRGSTSCGSPMRRARGRPAGSSSGSDGGLAGFAKARRGT